MAKGKEHGSQHFVPQCYTAAWTDPEVPTKMEPYVWMFERDSRVGRRKAPKNIFEETDFYTIKGKDGERDLRMEKWLSKLESNFVRVRKKIERHEKLDAADEAYLFAFVAAMEGRTKAQRDHQRRQWGEVKSMMDMMIEADARLTPEQRRSRVQLPTTRRSGDKPHGTYEDVKRFIENPMRMVVPSMIESMVPILARMQVLLFETDDPIGFITSDAPTIIVDPAAYKRGPMYRGAGLGYKTTEVSMALSPQQLIVFSHVEGVGGMYQADRQVLDEFNRRARMCCYEHYIVRTDQSLDAWFEKREDPPDSWEKTHPRETPEEGLT